jgi:SAM-dependent methyltransferase
VAAASCPDGEFRAALKGGRFASRQIYGRTGLIAWGHRRRFKTALALARQATGARFCDYGCGDGTFLGILMRSEGRPESAVGIERNAQVVADCRQRLGSLEGLEFISVDEIGSDPASSGFDTVFCMEVLEHVLNLEEVFGHLERLVAPSGRLVVSIPVETGLAVVVKQAARRLAGLRGIPGYVGHSGYSWKELYHAVSSGPGTRIPRIVHGDPADGGFYDHKGFNWMAMREEIADRFRIERTISSPFSWIPPWMGSQVWIVASKREAA